MLQKWRPIVVEYLLMNITSSCACAVYAILVRCQYGVLNTKKKKKSLKWTEIKMIVFVYFKSYHFKRETNNSPL